MKNIFEHQEIIDIEKYKKYLYFENFSRPLMLLCETINICNNRCIICANEIMKRKKNIMPLDLFEKVLVEYSRIGGGPLSLTPVVGDVFLDKYLVERFRLIRKYKKIGSVSFSTNAVLSDRFSDEDLLFIMERVERIYISVYGIDEVEYRTMTRRNTYGRLIKSVKRILQLVDDPNKIRFGFRCLRIHTEDEIRAWILSNFRNEIAFDHIRTFNNWGDMLDTTKALPFEGEWKKVEGNTSQCLIPLIACQVFSDGNVSFCPCCDFDCNDELHIGNIKEKSLADIYNSPKTQDLWNFEKRMPSFCRKCSFHISLNDFKKFEFIFENPYPLIGG
jgi:radical SAM protein with 4Fe4S-binding SPASM domain